MKFKELVSKLNEKLEEGKPETTKAYASATPGQGNIVFTPDTQYDGVAIAKELDPSGSIEKQVAKARTNLDIDADGDVDAMDKKNDNIPDEITGAEKKSRTLDMIKKGAKERAHTKKGVAYESVMVEKLTANDDTGKWIDDFQASSAPQFAGKNAEERRKMAIAAKLAADKAAGKKEEVEENAPVAPTLDRKYIKGTPEYKAHMAKKKPINGHPTNNVKEGKDDREYGYEGEMAITQLKTIMRHADHLMEMLKPETDLPEWVQSKITLSTDYMQTAHDYMMSEMTEAYESRIHGRITSAEVHKVLGPTKNAAQGIAALKKAFKVSDADAKAMLDKVMKESVEQIDEAEDKTLGRLKQLVRFGLMDKAKLPILARAMKSLEKGQVTNPTERATLFELLNELVGLVTGDDAMFAKVRMNVQKEEFDQE